MMMTHAEHIAEIRRLVALYYEAADEAQSQEILRLLDEGRPLPPDLEQERQMFTLICDAQRERENVDVPAALESSLRCHIALMARNERRTHRVRLWMSVAAAAVVIIMVAVTGRFVYTTDIDLSQQGALAQTDTDTMRSNTVAQQSEPAELAATSHETPAPTAYVSSYGMTSRPVATKEVKRTSRQVPLMSSAQHSQHLNEQQRETVRQAMEALHSAGAQMTDVCDVQADVLAASLSLHKTINETMAAVTALSADDDNYGRGAESP